MKKLVLLIQTLILLSFISCENNSNKDKWYIGGDLHSSTISDWNSSEEKNKLATCSDFIAKVDNTVSMDELKTRAINLKKCIDETVKGLSDETIKDLKGLSKVDTLKVNNIAALCITAMK